MSTKVYSVRIPKEIKKAMERLKDINWQDEIKKLITQKVKEESKKRLLLEAKELRAKMKSSNITEMIREDRDAR